MPRSILLTAGLGMVLGLSGCGESCESVQDEIEGIGREIQKNPSSAPDRAEELEELRDKLQEMGCLG